MVARRLTLVMGLTWPCAPAPQTLSNADLTTIVEGIIYFRANGLEDRTPIDFCAVPLLWDDTGRLRVDTALHPWVLYTQRTDCPTKPSLSPRQVIVTRIDVRADTVVARSTTIRGTARLLEEYEWHRLDDRRLWDREYRVIGRLVP